MQVDIEAVKRIKSECSKSTIIAATKYIDIREIKVLEENEITNFGENRVQALLEKYEQYKGSGKFHMIGTLQTNKVKYIIDKVCMIHSVDSIKLLKEIDRQACKHNLVMPILLQVNVAKEESKHGFDKDELEAALDICREHKNIIVKGLMMMAPNDNDVEQYFEETKKLLKIHQKTTSSLTELSMGMSNDYKLAIKHGATMLRLGSILLK